MSTGILSSGTWIGNCGGNVSLADLSLTYTFRPTILGAHYTVSLSIPYVWVDVEAKVSLNPRLFRSIIGNRTKTVRDGANGISDIFFVPFALNWTFGICR
jgi:hypothetical protein